MIKYSIIKRKWIAFHCILKYVFCCSSEMLPESIAQCHIFFLNFEILGRFVHRYLTTTHTWCAQNCLFSLIANFQLFYRNAEGSLFKNANRHEYSCIVSVEWAENLASISSSFCWTTKVIGSKLSDSIRHEQWT